MCSNNLSKEKKGKELEEGKFKIEHTYTDRSTLVKN